MAASEQRSSSQRKLEEESGSPTGMISAILGPLDNAPLQKFHLSAVFMAACGWVMAGWEYAMMTHVVTIMSFTKFANYQKGIPVLYLELLYISLFVGALIGQLFWGYMGDRYGRKKMFLIENVYTFCALVLTASATWGDSITVVALWVVFRVLVGIGIGGEYPLPAVLTAEFACKRWRGSLVGFVFASQAIGHVVSSAVGLGVVRSFKQQMGQCVLGEPCKALDTVWRVCLIISLVPAFIIFLLRNFLPESPRYTLFSQMNAMHAQRDVNSALEVDKNSDSHGGADEQAAAVQLSHTAGLLAYLKEPGVARRLAGCAASWFCKDINFGSIMLFGGIFVSKGFGMEAEVKPGNIPGHTIYDLWMTLWQGFLILYTCTNLLGFYLGVALIDVVGRRLLQTSGFFMSGVFLFSAAYFVGVSDQVKALMLIMAMLTGNIGPNLTVFVFPAELFKTKFRCRCFGLAAACGRLGTIVSLTAIYHLMVYVGERETLCCLGGFAVVGIFTTLLLPETRNRSLEELSGDTYDEPGTAVATIKVA